MSSSPEQSLAAPPGDCDEWTIGSAGVASAPSPFPRINAQRDRYLTSDYSVESQRAVPVTDAYRRHANEPQVVKVAHAFAHIVTNMKIWIDDLELIVGNCVEPAKACPVFPEFSYDWVVEELAHQPFRSRPHNRYEHTGAVDADLLPTHSSGCPVCTDPPWVICRRQAAPLPTTVRPAGRARRAGNNFNSPTCIESS